MDVVSPHKSKYTASLAKAQKKYYNDKIRPKRIRKKMLEEGFSDSFIDQYLEQLGYTIEQKGL